jgi:hypothetical protein
MTGLCLIKSIQMSPIVDHILSELRLSFALLSLLNASNFTGDDLMAH